MAASYTARGRSHISSRLLRLWGTAWTFSGSELHTGGEDGLVQRLDPPTPTEIHRLFVVLDPCGDERQVGGVNAEDRCKQSELGAHATTRGQRNPSGSGPTVDPDPPMDHS